MDRLTHLLLDAQHGDQQALRQFVAETHHDVLTMCRYLGDQDNSEDLAHDTYARAIASLHRFRADGPAKHWLLTIARRTCADATRKRIRRRRLEQRVLGLARDATTAAAADVGSPDWADLLDDLDQDRRAAFVVTQLNGLRYDEAAELLGVPIGTIRSRVSRARAQLVQAIEASERPDDPELDVRRERPGLG
jgi:RNA polymerase sigma-70 factor (ECF subfamily)